MTISQDSLHASGRGSSAATVSIPTAMATSRSSRRGPRLWPPHSRTPRLGSWRGSAKSTRPGSHKDDPAAPCPTDRDLILLQAMLYWLTNTSASSARIYYESVHSGVYPTSIEVPTGVAVFAEDTAIRRYGEHM